MRTPGLILGAALGWAAAVAAPQTAVFEGAGGEFRWPIAELNPDLPRDWSPFEFLTLEMRSSTPQRLELRVFTADGTRQIRLHPFPGTWIRAALPLAYFRQPDRQGFDLASVSNKPRGSYWIGLRRPFGPLRAVDALGVAMEDPVGAPTVEIRAVRLDRESPGDAVLGSGPLVDEFGQWIAADWPGKAASLDDLRRSLAAEVAALPLLDSNLDRFGGFKRTQVRSTGFFRVEQIDGRWWFVDPEGHLFFSTGVNVMVPWMGTRTEGRKGVFAVLPPPDLRPPAFHARETGAVSFYTWNLLRRFGPDWAQAWLDLSLRRMDAWGLNTIGNWSDPRLAAARRKPYVVTLRGWGIETGYLGLPDVFDEGFLRKVDATAAEQCSRNRDDPWLLGYFVANEPPWPDREADIIDAILAGPASAIQRETATFLSDGDTPERRREFVNHCIERLLDAVNAAIRRHDPNHLNLGLRFGSTPPDAMLRAARGFDVYSMNSYGTEVDRQRLEAAGRITGRPVLIGEFHFGVPGRGLAPGLVQGADQHERGVAYRHYVEDAAAHPAIVSVHWFEWVDEPNTGRFDGENYNIGLVDVTDRPYVELIEAMQATHRRLLDLHAGREPAVATKARTR